MLDPANIIQTVGIVGIILIVFLETGVFLGFFFPGDSLLFTAGLFAFQGFFDVKILIAGCIVAAVLGDFVGYWTGKKFGRKLFEKDKGFFFKKKRLIETEEFYEKHGRFTIIIARFVPIVRTFAPIVAGIGRMKYKTFTSYNIVGGILWVSLMIMAGYFLGSLVPNLDKYIIPIALLIIFISVIPVIIKFFPKRKKESK